MVFITSTGNFIVRRTVERKEGKREEDG